MIAITHDQRVRRDFVKAVRKLHKEHFGLSDDDIARHNTAWQGWLDLKNQEPRDLRSMLTDDQFADAHKGRALSILIAPKFGILPFDWEHERSTLRNYTFMLNDFDFSKLNNKLKQFLFRLLPICMKVAQVADMEKDRETRATMFFYRPLVTFALGILDEDGPLATELFELWQPLDPVVFWNMDDASGYDRVSGMLRAKIPVSWKWKTHERMKQIILAELSGKAELRADHEEARAGYLEVIQLGFYSDDGFPYEIELFIAQVEFLIGEGDQPGKRGFLDYHAQKILDLLAGEEHLGLRRRYVRNAILGDHGEHGSFGVYDRERLQTAQNMLDEAEEGDEELRTKLFNLMEEGRARIAERESAKAEETAQSNTVLSQMSA